MNQGRVAFALTVTGTAAAVALFVALWQLPVYSDGTTLAQTNGQWVLLVAAVPSLIAVIAWAGLHAACSRGSTAGHVLAGVVVGILGLFALVTGFSIGLFVAPVAGLLGLAVALTPRAAPAV